MGMKTISLSQPRQRWVGAIDISESRFGRGRIEEHDRENHVGISEGNRELVSLSPPPVLWRTQSSLVLSRLSDVV